MLVDTLHHRKNLVGLGQHLVLEQDDVALELPDIPLDLTDVPFDSTERSVVPKQKYHHLLHLIFNAPQIRERSARELLGVGRISLRFSHTRTI